MAMNAHDLADLPDLFGAWSCFTLVAGLAGVCYCRFHPKASRKIAAWSFVYCVLILFIVVPGSLAYSGPIPGAVREVSLYDKEFAGVIALVFGVGFAFDALRTWMRRKS